ncbi:hypothetical protein J6590_066362 [Homalodisca vitripennis]|nr:hypothetical protein J6590_066362 [Homalodisca vitripennis]
MTGWVFNTLENGHIMRHSQTFIFNVQVTLDLSIDKRLLKTNEWKSIHNQSHLFVLTLVAQYACHRGSNCSSGVLGKQHTLIQILAAQMVHFWKYDGSRHPSAVPLTQHIHGEVLGANIPIRECHE